ncbi:hypothetical protein QTP88_026586 [Uroleucon formosanum]
MGSVTIPLVYIILQNKTKQTYTEMLSVICAKCPNCEMVQITIDIEKAVVLAIEKVLPKNGLVKKYKDKQFQRDVAMITGLAFLPVNYVKKGMEILYEKFHNQDADQILTYFNTIYVNGCYRNKKNVELKYILNRTPPLFPPSIWNVFELTKAALQMSNSSASIKILNYGAGAFRNNLGKDDRLKKLCESFSNDDI